MVNQARFCTLSAFQGDALSCQGIDVPQKQDAGSTSNSLVEFGTDGDLGLGISVTGNIETVDFHDVNAGQVSDPVHNCLLSDSSSSMKQHCAIKAKFR